MSICQRLVLLEEFSTCPPFRRAEKSFLLTFPSRSDQALLGENGYHFLVKKQRLHPTDHLPSKIQYRRNQTTDTRFCPYQMHLVLRALHYSSPRYLCGSE